MTDHCAQCEGHDDGIGDALSWIARGHWQVVAVMAGGRGEPSFAYSTGLTSLGLPEVIIYGLSQQVGYSIVNHVAERLAAGEALGAGSRIPSGDPSYELVIIDAIDTSDMVQTAFLYPQFTALQVVYPDRRNAFPWDRGYALEPWAQPLMGPPPAT